MTLSDKLLKKIASALKWIFIGIMLGVMGGLLGTIFHISIDFATNLRENHSYLIYLLPVGGIVIAFMYNFFKGKGNIDIKRVFQSVRENKDIPLVMIPLIFIGALITHMLGGSAGREGAALQLGGSMGYNLAKGLKKDKESAKLMVTAGMSSVFSAVFGIPLAATFFSLEVTNGWRLNHRGVILGFISSAVAFIVSQILSVAPVRFSIPAISVYNADLMLKIALLALLCAGVCIVFSLALHKTEFWMEKYIPNYYVRAVIGGLLIVLLTIGLGTTDYNGAGMDVITRAISGEAKNSAFILKIIFTAITVAAGFKGGEIVPTFFIGATFGCLIGSLVGLNAGLGAAVGFVSMFAGMIKCPIASLLLAIEVFGVGGLSLFAIAVIITYVFSGRFGLYENAAKMNFGFNLIRARGQNIKQRR